MKLRPYISLFSLRRALLTAAVILPAMTLSCSTRRALEAKDLWVRNSSSPEQKVKAARALIPKGASLNSVKNILGPGWIWAMYEGPSVDLYNSWESAVKSKPTRVNHVTQTQTFASTYLEEDFLEYPVTNGYVSIRFTNTETEDELPHYVYSDVEYMLNIPNELFEPGNTNK